MNAMMIVTLTKTIMLLTVIEVLTPRDKIKEMNKTIKIAIKLT